MMAARMERPSHQTRVSGREAAFNGLIYANGDIGHLSGPARQPPDSTDPRYAPPALASFALVTIDGVLMSVTCTVGVENL